MNSRWKQRESKRPSTWRQSLLFNSLLLLLPIMAARILTNAYTSDIATDPMGLEARTETRAQIERSFQELVGPVGQERAQWASRIEQSLSERDFSAVRGYLISAPEMLDRQTSLAVLAAADAEEIGNRDERLARAALLFLPDPVRATYERAITPPQTTPALEPAEAETVSDEDPTELDGTPEPSEEIAPELPPTSVFAPLETNKSLDLIGTQDDLVRQSQQWLAEDPVDATHLRLRALALIRDGEDHVDAKSISEAASVIIAAQRSGRLSERFDNHIAERIDDAMPEQALREALATAFGPVLTTSQRTERVIEAYESVIVQDALDRTMSDLMAIARLIEITSSSGALTLLELADTPDDMRRALLLSESGGERAIALARELGPDVLGLAQIGVKWTRMLVLQVMALMALGMALLWTAMSAFTQNDTIHRLR